MKSFYYYYFEIKESNYQFKIKFTLSKNKKLVFFLL